MICQDTFYRHTVTVDSIIFTVGNGLRESYRKLPEKKLQVLLAKRPIEPHAGKWGFIGSVVRDEERFDDAIQRSLKEKANLKDIYLEQLYTWGDPNRDPRERVITIAYYALVRISEVKGGDDAAKAEWFPIDKIPALAFDHDQILRVATSELRRQIHFEPIGFELLPEKFTMTQLQHLYEAILGVKFDRRNFYNKMLKLGILTQLDETVPMPNKKVAYLYKFNPESYNEMKEKGFRLEF
jgi:8-oxo-dGTP diphosphatase